VSLTRWVDAGLKETLLDAAKEYQEEAAHETPIYPLFKGDTQLAGTFPSERHKGSCCRRAHS
jgi:hypothetical protein